MSKSVKDLLKEKLGIIRPIKEVKGNFNCSNKHLTSLEGCPEIVLVSFDCSYNYLTSLEGCPNKVGYNFYCGHQDDYEFSEYDVNIRCDVKREIYV